ncbi:Hpt domain-containing protein, partial [bacterium]|nr:Hpt domain-containing protein [bacterium]
MRDDAQKFTQFFEKSQEIFLEILTKEDRVNEKIVSDISTLMFLYAQIRELLSLVSEYESLDLLLRHIYNNLDRFTMMDQEISSHEIDNFLQSLDCLFEGLHYIQENEEYYEFIFSCGEQSHRKIESSYDLSFEFLSDVSDTEDYFDFIIEASELLDELNESILHKMDLDAVFRVIHTVKGTSSFLEELLSTMNHFCHEFESYIALVISKPFLNKNDENCIRRLLYILDIILNNLRCRLEKQDHFDESIDLAKILSGLQTLLNGISLEADDLYQIELLNVSMEQNIKVSALDVDQLAEGMEAFQLMLTHFRKKLSSDLYLYEEFHKIQNNFFSLQNKILDLRLFSIEPIFKKFARQIGEVSKGLNKSVDFHLLGLETKIDRNLSEIIIAPLTHIVRNAIVHGIEDSNDRVFAGKSKKGNIRLAAKPLGKNVLIEVSDDG